VTKRRNYADLSDVSAALQALERLVITVDFDSADAVSVDAAIAKVEAVIDSTIAGFPSHPLIAEAVSAMKAECRIGLHEQSAIAKRSILDSQGQRHTVH
jgi:hypothetical protein